MTCIVALVHGGKTYIGGDSAASNGHSITIKKSSKVFLKSGYLFGCSYSCRIGNIIEHVFEPPLYDGSITLDTFMCSVFIKSLRDCLKDEGAASKVNEEENASVHLLVSLLGRLFVIYTDYQISEAQENYAAVGSGTNTALGSLYTSARAEDVSTMPVMRLYLALEAAERFVEGVRSPFTIIDSDGRTYHQEEA